MHRPGAAESARARSRPSARGRARPRSPGPYLQIRGRTYYFRKRLSQGVSNLSAISFLTISLRTQFLREAMIRAARVLAALEKAEKTMTYLNDISTLTPEENNAILRELLRSDLADLLERYDSGAILDAEGDDLKAKRKALKDAARARDFAALAPDLRRAAEAAGVALPEDLPVGLGLQAAGLKTEIADVERAARDLENPRVRGHDLVRRFVDSTVDVFVEPRVMLEDAIAKTFDLYPKKDMKGNINAIAKLARYHFGNIPVEAITETRQEEFFGWMAQLPKTHGKAHGKNRYVKEGVVLDKNAEIAAADARDAEIIEEIRKLDLSIPEKRALIAERLTPRLTLTTMRRNRDGLARIFKAARKLGASVQDVLGYKDIDRIVTAAGISNDDLFMRVTASKLRMPWSEERLGKFLTSPLFTGHLSKHRRWKRGKIVTRDAMYWLPLIWLSLGSRHEEIALLRRSCVILRNNVWGLLILKGKTLAAERFLPLPQIILDLGFIDWLHALPDDHGPLLFPDAAGRSEVGRGAESFSRALGRILERLGLKDFDEDFYALRKTFQSIMSQHNVEDGIRESLAGHERRRIINKHYTAHETGVLKETVDKADFGLEISHSPRHGFPIIRSCKLGGAAMLDVEVVLGHDEGVERLTLRPDNQPKVIFSFDRSALPGDVAGRRKELRAAVREARRLTEMHTARMPTSPMKRRALESFLASA